MKGKESLEKMDGTRRKMNEAKQREQKEKKQEAGKITAHEDNPSWKSGYMRLVPSVNVPSLCERSQVPV